MVIRVLGSRYLTGILLAVVAVLGAAAPSQAAHSRHFHGVTSTSYPTVEQLQRLKLGGGDSVRVQLFWGAVEAVPGQFDWHVTDAVFGAGAQAGVRVLPVLWGSPAWATTANGHYAPGTPPIYTPEARSAWVRFLQAAATRYGTNGSFWTAHPELPRQYVKHWQVWNEVNLPSYWGGPPDARDYADLLRLTGDALHQVDPSVTILTAGILPYGSIAAGSISGGKYLRRFFRIRGVGKLFDVLCIHPYAARPRSVLELIEKTRRQLNSFGARRTPLWVTEFGWTTGGADISASPFRTTPSQQARKVRATYVMMHRQARRLKLKRAFYFSLQDLGSSSSWQDHMGLFESSGSPKPAWRAFARAAGGRP